MNHNDRKEYLVNIDIIKIISMLMICCLHYVGHGGVLASKNLLVSETGYLIKSFCIIGVNLFALTSGYLLCNKEFKLSRILVVWVQTVFWSYLIVTLTCVTGRFPGPDALIKSLLPVSAIQYWYITAYILLLMFVPLINSALKNISRTTAYRTLTVGALVFCLWRMIFPSNGLLELGKIQGYGLVWLMCMYFTGGVIRKYPIRIPRYLSLAMYVGFSLTVYFANLGCRHYESIARYDTFFDYSNLIVVFSSIALFEHLLSVNAEGLSDQIKKLTSVCASYTLSVYIIQEHVCLKSELWSTIYSFCGSFSLIIFLFLSVCCILLFYLSCIILDRLRGELFRHIHLISRIEAFVRRICRLIPLGRR